MCSEKPQQLQRQIPVKRSNALPVQRPSNRRLHRRLPDATRRLPSNKRSIGDGDDRFACESFDQSGWSKCETIYRMTLSRVCPCRLIRKVMASRRCDDLDHPERVRATAG